MSIVLSDATKKALLTAIKDYFLTEREEEMSDLQAGFLLDFILEEIGPSIYNQAVQDVQTSLQTTLADLDNTLYKPEFGYTARNR